MSHASDSSLSGSTEPILITNPHSDHARKEKQHSTIINKLRAMGANAVIDLPRITVIGNQSAGKSSLVEGISGINVPRDAGTCTRCPIECRLASSSEPWSGRVHIRREFDTRGKRLDVVGEEPFGPLLTDKQDIEGIIRRAQAALLNPGVEQSTFLHMPDNELKVLENELKFSRNTVCLDLTGPELADLAFVDLPGIVANADDDTVRLVEDLVISNIKGNCLILVTLPMSDDIENQKAARLAKQEDPSGIRTIGVLTKPDTLAHGATHSRELWLEVIKGRRFPLHHGYYCTRQPDDDERARGITTAQARAAEKDYFASIPPWSTLSEQHRLGKDNLVSALSRLFVQRADDAIPKIQGEVTQQLQACKDELERLPPKIANPHSYVLTLLTEFCSEVKLHVKGGTQASSLIQANHQTYASFKGDIRGSAPPFLPFPTASLFLVPANVSPYLRLEEEEKECTTVNPSPFGVRYIYLDDVREHIRKSRARELPNNVPYFAKVALIDDFQAPWKADSQKCFNAIFKAFEKSLLQLINTRFQRYDHLRANVTHAVEDLLRLKQDQTWAKVNDILNLEKLAYTQNSHDLQLIKDKHMALYKAARAKSKKSGEAPSKQTKTTADNSGDFGTPTGSKATTFSFAPRPPPISSPSLVNQGADTNETEKQNTALSALAALGIHVTSTDLGKLHGPDIYEEELEMMAEVRAYFQIAYKRVIDYVPMTIDANFLFALADSLQAFLIEKLGLGSQTSAMRCATYLSEDPNIVARRNELNSKKARLIAIQNELFNFGL